MMGQNHLNLRLLYLKQKTGYDIVQNNGQRRFGPPPDWTGPPPPRGCEIFVGNLPRDIFEDELVPIFSTVGKIYELRLMINFSGGNRGFGFVTYAMQSQAAAAIKQLNGCEVKPGWQIHVVKSLNNCRIFVSGIPTTKTKEDLVQELSKHVTGIVDVILHKSRLDPSQNRGFAVVVFMSHGAAATARRIFLRGFVKLWDQEVRFKWARGKLELDINNDEFMDQDIGYADPGGNSCNSADESTPAYVCTSNNAAAPAQLDAMCKRYNWAQPIYSYQKYQNEIGVVIWVCFLDLPQVEQPLVFVPHRIGPVISRAYNSLQQATVEAAENALQILTML